MAKLKRKVIQITTSSAWDPTDGVAEPYTLMLCDDGTVWELVWSIPENGWSYAQLPEVPQPEEKIAVRP